MARLGDDFSAAEKPRRARKRPAKTAASDFAYGKSSTQGSLHRVSPDAKQERHKNLGIPRADTLSPALVAHGEQCSESDNPSPALITQGEQRSENDSPSPTLSEQGEHHSEGDGPSPALVEHGEYRGPEGSYPLYLRWLLIKELLDLVRRSIDLGASVIKTAVAIGALAGLLLLLGSLGVSPEQMPSLIAKLLKLLPRA